MKTDLKEEEKKINWMQPLRVCYFIKSMFSLIYRMLVCDRITPTQQNECICAVNDMTLHDFRTHVPNEMNAFNKLINCGEVDMTRPRHKLHPWKSRRSKKKIWLAVEWSRDDDADAARPNIHHIWTLCAPIPLWCFQCMYSFSSSVI